MLVEKTIPLEFKFASGDAGEIAGLAAAFGNVDALGDIIQAGAFAASIAEHRAADTMPAMLWAHAMGEPVGRWTEFRETERGLEVRGKLSDTERGREARTLALDGALGLSIGFRTRDFDTDAAGHRILRAVDLVEVSLVAVPANSKARITNIKSALAAGEELSPQILERTLRDAGCPKKLAAGVIASGWKGARSESDAEVKSLVNSLNAATERLRKGN